MTNPHGRQYHPKPIPGGVTGDHRAAHKILNDWADHLYDFTKEVHTELERLREKVQEQEARIAQLEGAGLALATAVTQHISDPPPPPYT